MSDTFRKEYKPMSEAQKAHVEAVKVKADELLELFNTAVGDPMATVSSDPSKNGGRELALARTNLEQAIMWAVKGITS